MDIEDIKEEFKYFGEQVTSRVRFNLFKNDIVELIEQLKGDGWISVDTRLPKDYQTVLIYTKYGTMFMVIHVSNNEYIWGATAEWKDNEVTHWQPLPNTPNDNN